MTKDEKRDRREARHQLLELAEQALPLYFKLCHTKAQCRAAARVGVDHYIKKLS